MFVVVAPSSSSTGAVVARVIGGVIALRCRRAAAAGKRELLRAVTRCGVPEVTGGRGVVTAPSRMVRTRLCRRICSLQAPGLVVDEYWNLLMADPPVLKQAGALPSINPVRKEAGLAGDPRTAPKEVPAGKLPGVSEGLPARNSHCWK